MNELREQRKLKAGATTEFRRFKKIWRDDLSEFDRDALRSLFLSEASNPQIRAEIKSKYGIKLHRDDQVKLFADWDRKEQARDLESEEARELEKQLYAEHPDWTVDQVRDELIKRMMIRSLADGNWDLGLKTVDRHTKIKSVETDREKLELLKRKADAYDRAQLALTEAKQSQGGITPETLTKIERELKLL